MLCFFNCIQSRKFFRKNQRNWFSSSQILISHQIIEGVHGKDLEATLLFIDFPKAFDSIHRGKMEQILLAYGFPKETVTVIMKLYKIMKTMVPHPLVTLSSLTQLMESYKDRFYFNLPWLHITNINRSSERKWFHCKKARSRQYPAVAITDADNEDDLVLLANTPALAECLLHSLKQAARGIVLNMNPDKTVHVF